MSVDCSCGSSFRLRGHLWVVIGELPGPPEKVIVVSLSSKKAESDTTVVLCEGDHPFIKRETILSYKDARIFDKKDLVDRIERRFFEVNERFPEDKVKIMQQGILASPFTPNEIKSICKKLFPR
jgi:hypothetical protein